MHIHKGTRRVTKDIILGIYAINISPSPLPSQYTTTQHACWNQKIVEYLCFYHFIYFQNWARHASDPGTFEWVSIRLFVKTNPVVPVYTHCCQCGAGQEKQPFFFFPILSFCQKWTHLSKMVSLFFIVLKLNFSGLTLQLFLNVWFKNWVDCCYRSTSRLLHIIIQSSVLLAANPIFLWIYLKQLEGCARSPESLNLYFGLVVWWQFSVREKWGLYRNWCTLMTKWKRSPGKGILKQINRHMKLFRTPQFNSLCSCPLPPETQARENFYHL